MTDPDLNKPSDQGPGVPWPVRKYREHTTQLTRVHLTYSAIVLAIVFGFVAALRECR